MIYKIVMEDGTEIFKNEKSGMGSPTEQLNTFLSTNKESTFKVFWKNMDSKYNWGWRPLQLKKG
jgi:hypothetical protein